MATKRLNIELPFDQYEFLQREAVARGTTISGLIRQLIEDRRTHPTATTPEMYAGDPFCQRHGSFDGPTDLSVQHDRYLYESAPT